MMLALTHVSKEAYESLLKDGENTIGEISEEYGAGWPMRMQGILCAMCVRQCKEDSKELEAPPLTAEDLFELVQYYGYDEIFEDNGMQELKPKGALLESMLFSMCQAEMQDYGENA